MYGVFAFTRAYNAVTGMLFFSFLFAFIVLAMLFSPVFILSSVYSYLRNTFSAVIISC